MTQVPPIQRLPNPGNPQAGKSVVHPGAWEATGWKTSATRNRQFHSALKALPSQSLSRFSGRRAKPLPQAEVGRGFSGARYYNSHISVWLSVDPMSDKYPGMAHSPFSEMPSDKIKLTCCLCYSYH